jgi:hypothetical protein
MAFVVGRAHVHAARSFKEKKDGETEYDKCCENLTLPNDLDRCVSASSACPLASVFTFAAEPAADERAQRVAATRRARERHWQQTTTNRREAYSVPLITLP